MKKMLAILLALLMMLTGMATAEETTDNNTNISHMLELCQRVDILLHSDRIVTDLVATRTPLSPRNRRLSIACAREIARCHLPSTMSRAKRC